MTELQQRAYDAYVRAGGDDTRGALTAAAKSLGMDVGSCASAIKGYRRNTGSLPDDRGGVPGSSATAEPGRGHRHAA